ncbi:uncharacterized protein [Epargyreus clarus]|uniref:uncharacterized protein isoform X3 n=1 Tax=Epargyreus clarus TaxID=520877 RepID=UPI003C2BB52A
MAPGNKERHPGHTGTIPKTKVRNNCNVPQEAVTPTRRDMTTNLVTTSLDWVPVSEYNTRSNCNQSRKPSNNTSDHELTDLDNSVAFESGFGRFVPVRPQPRALPLTVQNRENVTSDHHDDGASASVSHTLHPYAHQMQNGLNPHQNHAAAAVMIVNPTTPNAVAGNMTQQFNAPNQNRNNLYRNLNSTRNTFEVNNHTNNNNATPPLSTNRSGTKTVNLTNNMYEQGQESFNNVNENNHVNRESARALGEAIVAACPDAAAVERRLGQIREYIRVTSSLVDTMRNSEDEQDVVVRPVSVQSNGSTYSENEIWQNEIKNKMEMSQIRLEALKQQQKRLLKYQAEAKAQLDEINKERQSQDISLPSTSHDNFGGMQNMSLSANYHQANRMYAANQIGVATTLPQSSEVLHTSQQMTANNIESEHGRSTRSNHSHEERFSMRDCNIASSEEAAAGGRDSEADDDESVLNERSRLLQMKLRELQLKKQHMENLVTEFQKLQMVTRLPSSHNTYSSSGEDSGDEEPSRKCNKSSANNKNEDPFKLMEIKAIRTALQKTKDLMRSVENYESEHLAGVHEDSFQMQGHSNIHDNKSEGGGSMGGWSNEGSVCRVRNSLPQRHKFTNEQHSQQHHQHQQQLQHQQQQQLQHQHQLQQQQLQQQQQQLQHQQQQQMQHQQHPQHQQQHQQHPQHQQQQQQNHEANINTLQELAQELRMETEKIMGERARIKDMVANKEGSRKQKKVNEEVRASTSAMGPAETRQMQLRALLAEKQRELEALLNKEKVMCTTTETQNRNPDSHTTSVVNQSYNSEQEEPESRSEHITLESQNLRENENFRGGGDSALGSRSINTVPSHLGSTYGSDSDSASRNKSNQRARMRRRQVQDRQSEENNAVQMQSNNTIIPNVRHEPRAEASTSNMPPPVSQNNEATANSPFPHLPPPCWNSTKSNQDTRSNQFTQNSHSQTMDRLLGTPQVSFPPTMPFNMMMPYGMVGACGCGCALWGAWCWQQLALQQRELHALREQLTHLEERWRAETASHTLNNQVPPGNRANNYWDNFRSYSRQNLLSTNSKTNADGHLGASAAHTQHPLVERSHNTLHHTSSSTSPSITPKRNTNPPAPPAAPPPAERRNVTYERSLSFSSAPDVLNVNVSAAQNDPELSGSHARNDDANLANVNINRQEPAPHFRNLSITNPIPEIVQSHSNNLNTSGSGKRKSSSKLPSKNSANRRNYTLDFSQTSNINIASTSETPNPNLASTSREVQDKATSKLFDLLRENVYSEVTTLIGVNESHPDFLIQLFRELQLISSDPLRQKVLQSIRNILSQYSSMIEINQNDTVHEESATEVVTTTSNEANNYHDCNLQNACSSTIQIDNKIVRFLLLKSEETCTSELLEALTSLIVSSSDGRQQRRLLEFLSKYEGLRVCDVSGDIIENLPMFIAGSNDADESTQLTSEVSESSILQDVAGSLNLFSSSETQLHQMNSCPYDMWPGHMHMDIDGRDLNDNSPRSSQDGKMDLINCSEMLNGDLAEADQTCRTDVGEASASGHSDELAVNTDALPDVVDTEEVTPTEAEAEWIGLDRVPTRLHDDETSEKQKGKVIFMYKRSKHSNSKLFVWCRLV